MDTLPSTSIFAHMLTRHTSVLIGVGMLTVVYATNNRFGLDEAVTDQYARDSYSYASIVESAPELPAEPIPFHHAQRLIPFCTLGWPSF